jgi:GAF domain-containing protein
MRIEDRLHATTKIEAEIVSIALEQTGAEHGALFVWDKEAGGLVLVHHVVNGVTVTLPRVVRHDGAKAGVALHVYDTDKPYLVPDTAKDPLYTRYLIDVGSIAAVPISYQRRSIGVLTVSTREPRGVDQAAMRAITAIADVAAPLLRRVQVDKLSRAATRRPLMI